MFAIFFHELKRAGVDRELHGTYYVMAHFHHAFARAASSGARWSVAP